MFARYMYVATCSDVCADLVSSRWYKNGLCVRQASVLLSWVVPSCAAYQPTQRSHRLLRACTEMQMAFAACGRTSLEGPTSPILQPESIFLDCNANQGLAFLHLAHNHRTLHVTQGTTYFLCRSYVSFSFHLGHPCTQYSSDAL